MKTAKIFLNAKGEMHDINADLEAFLDYAAGKKGKIILWSDWIEKERKAVKIGNGGASI